MYSKLISVVFATMALFSMGLANPVDGMKAREAAPEPTAIRVLDAHPGPLEARADHGCYEKRAEDGVYTKVKPRQIIC